MSQELSENEIKIIEICRKKGIDFLGYNEVNGIIEKILKNPEFLSKITLQNENFWDEAQKKGILIYSDYVGETENKKDECLVCKRQQFLRKQKFTTMDGTVIDLESKEEIPALTYQIRKKLYYTK